MTPSASESRSWVAICAFLVAVFATGGASAQAELSNRLMGFLPKPLPGWRAGPTDVITKPGGELFVRRHYLRSNNSLILMIQKSDRMPQGDPRKAVQTDPYLRRAGARIFMIKGRPAILMRFGGFRQGTITVNRKIMVMAMGRPGLGAPGLAQWHTVIQYLRSMNLDGLASVR